MAKHYSSKSSNNSIAYVNGRVYTVDDSRPWASAFIVSPAGLFEAVGDDDEMQNIAKCRGLITYDLGGKFVMPGLHDAHTHLLMSGEKKLYQHNFEGDQADRNSLAQLLQQRLCVCDYANVVGDWIIGNYYLAHLFPDGKPDRSYLDGLFPDTPVLVREQSLHKVLLNTTALKRVGLDPEKPGQAPHGGMYVLREDGRMTGELLETATRDAWLNLPIPPLVSVKKAILNGVKSCHKYGITSVQEASANTLYLHAVRELDEAGKLPIDMYTHIICKNEFFAIEKAEDLDALLDISEAFKSKHVDTRFVKFWLDGSPIEPGSTHCSLDEHGQPERSKLFFDDETLFKAVLKYDAKGMTCKMHASGEGSVHQALNVYERVRKLNPDGPRHEIAHSNAISPGDFQRVASLRVTAEMSPAVFHIADVFPQLVPTLRYEVNEVHAAGGTVTVGSDYPVIDAPNLFPPLEGLVKKVSVPPSHAPLRRRSEDSSPTKEEIAAEILCRVITLGAAENLGKGDETGSISVNKKANFIAVDRDLTKGSFDGAVVLKTWFEGELVWDIDGEFKTSV